MRIPRFGCIIGSQIAPNWSSSIACALPAAAAKAGSVPGNLPCSHGGSVLEMIRRLATGLKLPADVLIRGYGLKKAA